MAQTTVDPAHDPLSSTLRPPTDATLTIRCIKSLTFRNVKPLILQHVDLEQMTVGQLKDRIRQEIQSRAAFKPYRTATFDTLKIYTHAHGAKVRTNDAFGQRTQTTNLAINLDRDDWLLTDDNVTLASIGLMHESELSFYSAADYDAYRANPESKW